MHVAKVKLAANVDLDQIAGLTPGFTGADLANLKQFPAYLNRWDSQQARNEGVFAH